jgi:CBS domain-containing protein
VLVGNQQRHAIETGEGRLRLEDAMSVESILKRKGTEVATIAPDASVKRAADWLHAKNIGALVVTHGNALLGLISEREIVHAISRYGETATSMPVSEIMRHGVITVSPAETVSHAMNQMTRHRVRHMPVVHDGKLAGIISIGDVVKHRLDDLELETNVLRDARVASR